MCLVERNVLKQGLQRRGIRRQAEAESIRGALEDQGKPGGALRQILLDLCAGALDVGIVDTLAKMRRTGGNCAKAWLRGRCPLAERLYRDSVTGMGNQGFLEGPAVQRLCNQRKPTLSCRAPGPRVHIQGFDAHPTSSFCCPHDRYLKVASVIRQCSQSPVQASCAIDFRSRDTIAAARRPGRVPAPPILHRSDHG